jgi:hypothetical protein
MLAFPEFQREFRHQISELNEKLRRFSEDREFVEVLKSLYDDIIAKELDPSLEDFFRVFTIIMVEKINGPRWAGHDIALNPLYRSMKECGPGDDACILLEAEKDAS